MRTPSGRTPWFTWRRRFAYDAVSTSAANVDSGLVATSWNGCSGESSYTSASSGAIGAGATSGPAPGSDRFVASTAVSPPSAEPVQPASARTTARPAASGTATGRAGVGRACSAVLTGDLRGLGSSLAPGGRRPVLTPSLCRRPRTACPAKVTVGLQRRCNPALPTLAALGCAGAPEVRLRRRADPGGPRDPARRQTMTVYAAPGTDGAIATYRARYDHWIGGEYVPPANGQYFENPSPVTGRTFTEVARGDADAIDRALGAAHGAAPAWGRTSVTERAIILNKIADRMEEHLEELAVAETWENGKPVRETLNADMPLAIDHFRYFAGATRAQEGSISEIDGDTIAYHFHEPLGVVGQIIPWNFPILMAVWKLAPALAAGNAVVLKPAEQTPASILYLMELIADLLPPGVVNVVNGFGAEAGKPL